MRRARLGACLLLLVCGAAPWGGATEPSASFWHVGIVVEDLERMHTFYTRVLQLRPVTDLTTSEPALAGAAPNELRVPGLDRLLGLQRIRLHIRHVDDGAHPMFLELLRYVNHPRGVARRPINAPGLNHIGLEVTDLDQILERMRTLGLGRAGPIVTMPMFNGRLVIVRDPEGNVLELRESFKPTASPTSQPNASEVQAQMSGQGSAGAQHPGAALYEANCAACHSGRTTRAPHKSFLEMYAPDQLLGVMESGQMRPQAAHLSGDQRLQIVEYLVGTQARAPAKLPAKCTGESARFDYAQRPVAKGWGVSHENTRFLPGDVAKLRTNDIARLRLKWAFAFPGASRARSQPAFAGGQVMMGSQDGTVYALDATSGCLRWTFRAGAEVRTGITVEPWDVSQRKSGPILGWFGDLVARVYAIDIVTGQLVWVQKVDEHPNATTTAQPAMVDGVVYAPVSSLEVVPAADPSYPCCSFRGSVVALDARTGAIRWKSFTIAGEPREVARNARGTPILAASGAPIWNSPTIDRGRGVLYNGTGENYSGPADGNSDAILSIALADGARRWTFQATAGDAWNLACMPFIADKSNCPAPVGPDVDFAAAPILVRDGPRELLVAGQKSGAVWALDPGSGKLVWSRDVGRGGNQGGIHFGLATDGQRLFVPMSDYDDDMLPKSAAKPGLYALDVWSGQPLWSRPAEDVCGDRKDCDPGISQAITAIPGAVFAGHMDGRLRAYSAVDGTVLWEVMTDREWPALGGATARGGSFGGGAGPMIVDGHVYATSGYGLYFHMPGNALLVFSVDGK